MVDLLSPSLTPDGSTAVHGELEKWCLDTLNVTDKEVEWQALSGDAGFRRYFRLTVAKQHFIAVVSPPSRENNQAFVNVAEVLHQFGLLVPRPIAVDFAAGFMLLPDFGDDLLFDALTASRHHTKQIESYYHRALDELLKLSCGDLSSTTFAIPNYDATRLYEELALFPQWFLHELLQLQPSRAVNELMEETFSLLVASALEQPQVLVHRDYHSRNILVFEQQLAVIDFQDAVVGPVTYDVISLLRDCYITWPQQQVVKWANYYREAFCQRQGIAVIPEQRWLYWMDCMSLQRHLKVLGIFARLWLRDGKPAYLAHLPTVLQYISEISAKLPQLQPWSQWFKNSVLPHSQQQSWYHPPPPP